MSQWEFYHNFSTSRSTYYVEIPNGSPSNSQQVKVVNVLQEDGVTYAWELRADEEILVNIPALSVIASDIVGTEADESASVVAGGNGAELISAGDGADTMLGGGGADTYAIGANDSASTLQPMPLVVGDVINEIGGDIASTLGDSINFTARENIDDFTFVRTKIRYEEEESTLQITANNGGGSFDVVHIFDHYSEDLPFRQVEQHLDEGWGLDQIWNLVADGNGGVNRDILIGDTGDNILVSGGVDVMQGGDGKDTFVLGTSDVAIGDIDTAHGSVTMIRDFISADDSIDLTSLGINNADVNVQRMVPAKNIWLAPPMCLLS